MIDEEKDFFRRKMKEYRKNLSSEERIMKDDIIYQKVIKNKMIISNDKIGIYISKKEEINTKKIIDQLIKMNKKIYIPKVIDNDLYFTFFDGNYSLLKKNKFNILEVDNKLVIDNDVDVIILPSLSVGRNRYRLGYGKGYYDRYLFKKRVYSIALVYREQIVDNLPFDDKDYQINEYISD